MQKIIAVLFALFALSLAKDVYLNWDCMFHVRVTNNKTKDYVDQYRLTLDSQTTYSLQYLHQDDGNVTMNYAIFNQGSSHFYTLLANYSGECAKMSAAGNDEIYGNSYSYVTGPEQAKCPDGSNGCWKYCNLFQCIVIDEYHQLQQVIDDDGERTYTYIDDNVTLDMFNVNCNGTEYSAVDCCDYDTTSIDWDCTFHVKVISNLSDTKYYDEYRMTRGSDTAYSLRYVHDDEDFYYELIVFDLRTYPVTHEVLTNKSGNCTVLSNAALDEVYDGYFYSVGESESVNCPNGKSGCTKYCTPFRCIVTDDDDHLVQDINLETSEALTYKYLDDEPEPEMFNMKCGDKEYKAIDYCTKSNVYIDWDCYSHARIKSSKYPNAVIDEYRMLYKYSQTAYLLDYVQENGKVYFELDSFDLKYGFAYDVVTNKSGDCENYFAMGHDIIYESEFQYYGEPEDVKCPDGKSDCKQYCSMFRCIVLDEDDRLMQDTLFENYETRTYTYIDDNVTADTFSLECGGQKYIATDYCDMNLLFFDWDCAFHVKVTSNSSSKIVDEYRMMYGGQTAYSMQYVNDGNESYYGLTIFDILDYPVTANVMTNKTGKCKFKEDVDYYEIYDTAFTYFGKTKSVKCPDGKKDCTLYCSADRCIVADSENHLLQDINKETHEALTYTYLDDVPTPDMFDMKCDGEKNKAIDFCTKKSAHINWDCSFHVKVTSNASDDTYYDEYRMMSEGRIAYLFGLMHEEGKVYYELDMFDLEDSSALGYTMLTNSSGECEEYLAIGDDEIYNSEFVYYLEPEEVKCPSGKGDCMKYCSMIRCIILDEDKRLMQDINSREYTALSYTYLGDVPSVDKFTMECAGTKYTAKDYCPKRENSEAQVSASSITKAAIVVLLAALLAALL